MSAPGGATAQEAAAPRDPFAALKHVDLSDGGAVWVGFGGHVRQRFETFRGFNFGAPPGSDPDDAFSITRIFLSADLHLGSHFRLFAEGKSSLATAPLDDRRPIDTDEVDLQQLYGEVRAAGPGDGALSLRFGRHEMSYGRERLVSPLDWANTRRTFEGFTASWQGPAVTVSGFWARPVTVRPYDFNRRDSSVALYGLYTATRQPARDVGLDVYWIGLHRDAASYNGTTGRERRHTVGARLWGPLQRVPGFDYDIEAAGQFGEIGPGTIRAYMLGAQFGRTFSGARGARVYLGLDYASGDDAPGGDVGTFSQLYPLAHGYLGFLDTVARMNVVDLSFGASARAAGSLTVLVDVHLLLRASSGDAMYGPLAPFFGAPRGPGTSSAKRLGTEPDLTVRWVATRNLTLSTGLSHFWPGAFLDETGAANGTNLEQSFAYVGAQFVM